MDAGKEFDLKMKQHGKVVIEAKIEELSAVLAAFDANFAGSLVDAKSIIRDRVGVWQQMLLVEMEK